MSSVYVHETAPSFRRNSRVPVDCRAGFPSAIVLRIPTISGHRSNLSLALGLLDRGDGAGARGDLRRKKTVAQVVRRDRVFWARPCADIFGFRPFRSKPLVDGLVAVFGQRTAVPGYVICNILWRLAVGGLDPGAA